MSRAEVCGIVTYGAGNLFSLCAALDRLNLPYKLLEQPDSDEDVDRYIIPGVGHAGKAMEKLEASGFIPMLAACKKPVLGICVGMQLLTEGSEESDEPLTGIIPLKTKLFRLQGLKVPHMGWNTVTGSSNDPLLYKLDGNRHFYFVHSFFVELNTSFTLSTTLYGDRYTSVVRKNNFYGVQFHPEKSGVNGEQLLKNFFTLVQKPCM